MRLREITREVYVADEPIVNIAREEIEFLKSKVIGAPRGRVRLCAHRDSGDSVHEMIIVLTQTSYVRPHKHFGKSESFHIIEGAANVIVFDDDGNIIEVIPLGDFLSGKRFYYRLADPKFHTLIIRSDALVIHETTSGPFKKGDALFAPWAPDEDDPTAGRQFMQNLSRSADEFLSGKC